MITFYKDREFLTKTTIYLRKILMRMGLLVCILLLSQNLSFAQSGSHTITGTISASIDKSPLPGVNISIKGTSRGVTTDITGKYSIEASENDVLVFSFIGYNPQEIKVGNSTKIDVELIEDIQKLQEVVVVGYGEMKKADISGAQTSLSAKDISKTVNTTLEQAIQGRAANVYVTQNSGQPGGGISVNIRGIATVNGNTNPLYVVDGVQIQSDNGGSYGNTSSISPLAGLNPGDIESIEILQGPSATAIYGSRGSNGVVLITTKRGKSGKMNINYSMLYSMQDTPKILPTLSLRDYATMVNEYKKQNNQTAIPEFQDPSVLGEGTNWQKELFRRVPLTKHQLSLSGGSDKTTFYLSGELFNQEGVVIGSNFNRYSFRLNVDNQTRKWLKIGTNLNMSQTNDKVNSTANDIINIALEQAPNVAVKNPDGSWGGPATAQFSATNPVAIANLIDNRVKRTNALGGFNLEINPIKGLYVRSSLNAQLQFSTDNTFTPTYQIGSIVNTTSTLSKSSGNSFYWNWNQMVEYNRTFGDHSIRAMFTHEAQESRYEGLTAGGQGLIVNNIPELGLADAKSATNGSSRGSWGMESYLGRINYAFRDKYFVQASFRRDGSPNFGENNRWGTFPAASAAWRISQEPFMSNVPVINELKLRLEAGTTGNQGSGGRYASLNSYATPWGTGFLPANYIDPNYQWEPTLTYNAGFNLSLFRSRIQIEADFYIKKTNKLIIGLPLPDYMGTTGNGSISPPNVNIGDMENKGYGVSVNTINIDTKGFKWTSNFNISGFTNKLTKLYTQTAVIDRNLWVMSNFLQRSVVGQPLWQFYGFEKLGIFQSVEEIQSSAIPKDNVIGVNGTWVGDFKYKDVNGDGVIDGQDRTFIGSPIPKFTFGFTNTFSYKNFDLSVLLTGTYGNSIFNYNRFKNENVTRINVGRGLLASVAEYARLSDDPNNPVLLNPGTTIPRITGNGGNGNYDRPTKDFIEDGSYLRVKNIQLTYSFSKSILSYLKVIDGLRLTVGVQNAATLTKYKGYDPEVGAYIGNASNPNQPLWGVDYGRYPITRVYTFSLGVDF